MNNEFGVVLKGRSKDDNDRPNMLKCRYPVGKIVVARVIELKVVAVDGYRNVRCSKEKRRRLLMEAVECNFTKSLRCCGWGSSNEQVGQGEEAGAGRAKHTPIPQLRGRSEFDARLKRERSGKRMHGHSSGRLKLSGGTCFITRSAGLCT